MEQDVVAEVMVYVTLFAVLFCVMSLWRKQMEAEYSN